MTLETSLALVAVATLLVAVGWTIKQFMSARAHAMFARAAWSGVDRLSQAIAEFADRTLNPMPVDPIGAAIDDFNRETQKPKEHPMFDHPIARLFAAAADLEDARAIVSGPPLPSLRHAVLALTANVEMLGARPGDELAAAAALRMSPESVRAILEGHAAAATSTPTH